MKTKSKNRGFIALMSAILISTVLLALLVTSNMSSFYVRFDVQDAQSKREARALAEACANVALLRLTQNYQYDPHSDTVSVGERVCSIRSITPPAPRSGTSTMVTVDARGSELGAFSTSIVGAVVLNPTISPTDVPLPQNITITSWQDN